MIKKTNGYTMVDPHWVRRGATCFDYSVNAARQGGVLHEHDGWVARVGNVDPEVCAFRTKQAAMHHVETLVAMLAIAGLVEYQSSPELSLWTENRLLIRWVSAPASASELWVTGWSQDLVP